MSLPLVAEDMKAPSAHHEGLEIGSRMKHDFRDELVALMRASGEHERGLEILEMYFGLRGEPPLVLQAIGDYFGFTRERARQLRDRALDGLSTALCSAEPESLRHLGALIDRGGGVLCLKDAAERMLPAVGSEGFSVHAYLTLLVDQNKGKWIGWLHPSSNLLIREGPSRGVVEAVSSAIEAALAAAPAGLTISELAEIGRAIENTSPDSSKSGDAIFSLARDVGHEVVPGLFAKYRWSRSDYSFYVLLREGGPLHFREIARLVDELVPGKFAVSGFNTLLNTDTKFVRVGAGDFGLPEWGGESYGKFDEVIARYLDRGRKAEHIERIVSDLQSTYTIAESTIRAMLSWHPRTFQYYGGGFWGLRGLEPAVSMELLTEVKTVLIETGWELTPSEVEAFLRGMDGYVAGEPTRALFLSPEFKLQGSNKNPVFVLAERYTVDADQHYEGHSSTAR